MRLSEQLNEDMKTAMRSQDKFRLSVIRMLRAAVKNAEIDSKHALDDQEVEAILAKELKQRQDSLLEFEKAGRQDLVDHVKAEIEIISRYLPEPFSEEEIAELVEQAIRDTGAATKADMGKVMAVLMPKVKGRADGKLVNRIVQQRLS
jgi:hypothetical protein